MSPRTTPACPLTLVAWRLGGPVLSDLWCRYIGLGGHHPQSVLSAYLDGSGGWSDTEHNVLAQALNEGLWELGLPSVAPCREPERAARDAAPGTHRSPP